MSKVDGPLEGQSFPAIFAQGESITIPDVNLMFCGQYSRQGHDLLLSGENGDSLLVVDYFSQPQLANLVSPDGATLKASVVNALAGPMNPGEYAQTGDQTIAAGSIGKVVNLEGTASVQRTDGTTVALNVGDPLAQGDVLQTGASSTLGVVFTDGTVFTLSAGSRMVLDNLVYQPGGSDNALTFNVVQGTFAFVAGQVAPTGEMNIETPTATLGVRGTTAIIRIDAATGRITVQLVPDPDGGHLGEIVLMAPNGTILATLNTEVTVNAATGETVETPPTAIEIINALIRSFNSANPDKPPINEIEGNNQDGDNAPGDDTGDAGGESPISVTQGSGGDMSIALTDAAVQETLVEYISLESALPPLNAVEALPPPPTPTVQPAASAGDVEPPAPTSPPPPPPPPPPLPDLEPVNLGNSDEDADLTITVVQLLGAPAPAGVTVSLAIAAGTGTLEAIPGGWIYTPGPNDASSVLFSYSVSNGTDVTSEIVTLDLTPVNDAPALAGDLAATVAEGGEYVLTGADLGFSDPDNVAAGVTFTVSSQIAGTILVNGVPATSFTGQQLADGLVAFEHDGSETTTASFNVQVEDGNEDGSPPPEASTFNFTVTSTNVPPTLTGDLTATVVEGGLYVLTESDIGFSDPDDVAAGVTFTVSQQVAGTILVNGVAATSFTGQQLADGLVAFEHDGSETTTASFNVQVEDGNEDGSPPPEAGTFNFTVTSANVPPSLAGDLAATVAEGSEYVLTESDLGFSDPDDVAAGVTFTVSSQVAGTILVNGVAATSFTGAQLAAGLVAFQHDGSETTTASFNVQVEDGNEDGSTPPEPVPFNFTVTPVNDAPTLAGDLAATVAEGGEYVLTESDLGFSDPDDVAAGVTFTVSSLVAGTIRVNGLAATSFTAAQLAVGLVVFLHDGSETLAASFDVQVEDVNGDVSVTETFNFTVTPVNDGPVGNPDTLDANEDTPITYSAAQLLGNDTPSEGLFIASVTPGTGGTVELVEGSVLFTPAANFFGPATFTYTVSDGVNESEPVQVNVSVASDGYTAIEAAPFTGTPDPDEIYGTAGSDLITGNGGNDLLYGDTGADTYVWRAELGEFGNIISTDGYDTIVSALDGDNPYDPESPRTSDVDIILIEGINGTTFYDYNFEVDGQDLLIGVTNDPVNYSWESVGGYLRIQDFFAPGGDTIDYMEADLGDNNQWYSPPGENARFYISAGVGEAQGDYYEIILGTSGDDAGLTAIRDAEDYTGTGTNRLFGFGGNDELFAANGTRSVLLGGNGNDDLHGSDGWTDLRGGNGNDDIFGGSGTDRLNYSRNATSGGFTHGVFVNLSGEEQTHLFNGQSFTVAEMHAIGNWQDLGLYGSGTYNDVDVLYSGIEDVIGSRYEDVIFGNDLDNSIEGLAGDDWLFGGEGGDYLSGGAGNDLLDGEGGSDTVDYYEQATGMNITLGDGVGSATTNLDDANGQEFVENDQLLSIENVLGSFHDDNIIGDDGNNYIDGRGGSDNIDGGEGWDSVSYQADPDGVEVDLAAGIAIKSRDGEEILEQDTLQNIQGVNGSEYVDTLIGDNYDNTFQGRGGDDKIDGGGNSEFGGDYVDYWEAPEGVFVDLQLDPNDPEYPEYTGTAYDGYGGIDYLANIENILGSFNGDELRGDANANYIEARDGADIIEGRGGNDYLVGGLGVDTYYWSAGDGDDTISRDLFNGDTSNEDIIHFEGTFYDFDFSLEGSDLVIGVVNESLSWAGGNIRLENFVDPLGAQDTINYIEADLGENNGNYSPDGGLARVYLSAVTGVGQAIQGNNTEFIFGTTGNDTMTDGGGEGFTRFEGGDGNDTMTASGESDTVLVGGDGDDTLNGGALNDQLRGAAGNDTMHGNGGSDILRYDRPSGSEQFTHGVFVNLSELPEDEVYEGQFTIGDFTNGEVYTVSVNVAAGQALDNWWTDDQPENNVDTIYDVDEVRGSEFDDVLIGFNHVLEGLAGNDALIGKGDSDTVKYNQNGEHGAFINLSNAAVTYNFYHDGFVSEVLVEGGTALDNWWSDTDSEYNIDTFEGIENVVGSRRDDVIIGSDGVNNIDGGNGDDTIMGIGGADIIDGGDGSDTVSYHYLAGTGVIVNLAENTADDGETIDEVYNIENIVGSNYDDELIGDDGINIIRGLGGVDTLTGGAGWDQFIFGSSPGELTSQTTIDDFVVGEDQIRLIEGVSVTAVELYDGEDLDSDPESTLLTLSTGSTVLLLGVTDTVVGESTDPEAVEGDAFSNTNELIFGGNGEDTLIGYGGDDVLIGGLGIDYYQWSVGEGFDTIIGDNTGASEDIIQIFHGDQPAFYDYAFSIDGEDLLIGVTYDEVTYDFAGGALRIQNFFAGNDSIAYMEADVGANNEFYNPGENPSRFYLSAVDGTDQGEYWEVIFGTDGNDTMTDVAPVYASEGVNRFLGFDGDDYMQAADGQVAHLIGGDGNDEMHGGDQDDHLRGGAGSDILDGGVDGVDLARYDRPSGSAQFAHGVIVNMSGDALFQAVFQTDVGAYFVDVESGEAYDNWWTPDDPENNIDTLSNIDNVRGSNFDDILIGSGSGNELEGRGGADILEGGAGSDILDGGDEVDLASYDRQLTSNPFSHGVFANLSDTAVEYNFGHDGTVTLVEVAAQTALDNWWTDTDPENNVDTLISIEHVRGSSYDDVLIGDDGSNDLFGFAGGDILVGGAGSDILEGGAGSDTLDGGSDADTDLFVYGVDGDGGQVDQIFNFVVGEDYLRLIDGVTAVTLEETISDTTVTLSTGAQIVLNGVTGVGSVDDLIEQQSFSFMSFMASDPAGDPSARMMMAPEDADDTEPSDSLPTTPAGVLKRAEQGMNPNELALFQAVAAAAGLSIAQTQFAASAHAADTDDGQLNTAHSQHKAHTPFESSGDGLKHYGLASNFEDLVSDQPKPALFDHGKPHSFDGFDGSRFQLRSRPDDADSSDHRETNAATGANRHGGDDSSRTSHYEPKHAQQEGSRFGAHEKGAQAAKADANAESADAPCDGIDLSGFGPLIDMSGLPALGSFGKASSHHASLHEAALPRLESVIDFTRDLFSDAPYAHSSGQAPGAKPDGFVAQGHHLHAEMSAPVDILHQLAADMEAVVHHPG